MDPTIAEGEEKEKNDLLRFRLFPPFTGLPGISQTRFCPEAV